MKKWMTKNIKENVLVSFSNKYNINKLVSKIILSRFDDEHKAHSFLFQSESVQNPYDIKDMDKAVDIIRKAISENKKITVFGDYDADGVTSTAVLYNYFLESYTNVDYYISDRFSEGYGINKNAIDKLISSGTHLIITVDNGINAFDAVDYAMGKGISVIITDHHVSSENIPNACAVVDPNRYDCTSGYKYYAGVGVVFKLICALEDNDYEGVLNRFSDLICIGTISDLVPVVGENRLIVKHGLLNMVKPQNNGVEKMLEFLGLSLNDAISSSDIAFMVSPRINAAGRMNHAYKALDVFIHSQGNVEKSIKTLDELNSLRKTQEKSQISLLDEVIFKDTSILNLDVLVIFCENLNQGIIGILASRICEKYAKPTIILTNDKSGQYKASGRSVIGFDMFSSVLYCRDLLLYYGGHKMACGFSIKEENLKMFTIKINEYFKNCKMDVLPPVINIDAVLTMDDLSVASVESLNCLEPFGTGNKTPYFSLEKAVICDLYEMGDGSHSRLKLKFYGEIIYVNWFKKQKRNINYDIGDLVDIAVDIGVNYYNGKKSVSINLIDIKISGLSDNIFSDFQIVEKLKKKEELSELEVKKYTPNRDDIALVYKALKSFSNHCCNLQKMFFKLGNGNFSYSKILISLWVLYEFNLISISKKGENIFYKVLSVDKKVDIEKSEIIKNLNTKRKIN